MAIATRLQNPTTLSNRIGYEGFSWTCFFFGPFPALIRGDLLGFAAMAISAFMTFGLSGFIWIFVYNRWHYNRLLARGFQPAGSGFLVTQSVSIGPAVSDISQRNDKSYEDRPYVSPSRAQPEPGPQRSQQLPVVATDTKRQPDRPSFGRRQSKA
ncbi:hypothetical protein [Mesorhizobium sp. B1-1-5]|uniref:hypothetical protein n=1 Tax=Mesorhizobium sp. B1-1-5 TaxID=2589979 RepID=UPI00112C8A7C|nr:hypothetical protein [Mesorhizobium sp. B1-1-5]TPO07134.1 hypothetical protein FJ980_12485 [Mesorhizobium sp. B1-1-5]